MFRRWLGRGLADVIPARGAAFGDLFNDGKIDVVINPIDGPAVLLRNVNPDHHHWVELKLVGTAKAGRMSPRDAMCATVYLKANGMTQRDDVMSGGSYISSNDQRLHFGLGDATDAGTAEIHWPSGAKQTVKLPAVDRIYTITEGKGITGALCGGKPCGAETAREEASASRSTPRYGDALRLKLQGEAMRIAIIGGGIAGLAAAYELELARSAGTPVEYELFEAGTRSAG
jgi:hypothetical protein